MSSNSSKSQSSNVIDDAFIAEVYQQMLAFATSQLKDSARAEDAVQEALLSAIKYTDKFEGKASFKTWVFSILKNKIVDDFRKNDRYVQISQMQSNSDAEGGIEDEAFLDILFSDIGHWHQGSKPKAFDDSWCDPEQHAHSDGFFQVLQLCLDKLPADQARVFLMKEYMELDTAEICDEVGITSKNFYVLMHRCRLRLQHCLNNKWFDTAV